MKHKTQNTKIQNAREAAVFHVPCSMFHERGFTLLEILVVVSIVALLYVVALVGYDALRERARKNAAIAVATTVIKELLVCAESNGFAIRVSAPTPNTTFICCDTSSCAGNNPLPGFSAKWPDLGQSGWSYGDGTDAPSGSLISNPPTYSFNLVKGTKKIICALDVKKCYEP